MVTSTLRPYVQFDFCILLHLAPCLLLQVEDWAGPGYRHRRCPNFERLVAVLADASKDLAADVDSVRQCIDLVAQRVKQREADTSKAAVDMASTSAGDGKQSASSNGVSMPYGFDSSRYTAPPQPARRKCLLLSARGSGQWQLHDDQRRLVDVIQLVDPTGSRMYRVNCSVAG